MNLHFSFATTANMTSKGQVLVPKPIRDRVGLVPGQPVRIAINDRGEAVILPGSSGTEETSEQRRIRVLAAIDSIPETFRTGQSTDDYMAELRGPHAELP
jgi:AbrB family looped-hinge helix DNA binding protein